MTKFLFVRHGEPDYSSVAAWRIYRWGKTLLDCQKMVSGRLEIVANC